MGKGENMKFIRILFLITAMHLVQGNLNAADMVRCNRKTKEDDANGFILRPGGSLSQEDAENICKNHGGLMNFFPD